MSTQLSRKRNSRTMKKYGGLNQMTSRGFSSLGKSSNSSGRSSSGSNGSNLSDSEIDAYHERVIKPLFEKKYYPEFELWMNKDEYDTYIKKFDSRLPTYLGDFYRDEEEQKIAKRKRAALDLIIKNSNIRNKSEYFENDDDVPKASIGTQMYRYATGRTYSDQDLRRIQEETRLKEELYKKELEEKERRASLTDEQRNAEDAEKKRKAEEIEAEKKRKKEIFNSSYSGRTYNYLVGNKPGGKSRQKNKPRRTRRR